MRCVSCAAGSFADFYLAGLVAAQDHIGGAQPYLQRAGEDGLAHQFDLFAFAETQRKQALMQGLIGVDGNDGGEIAWLQGG
jgi:hypothetical protein